MVRFVLNRSIFSSICHHSVCSTDPKISSNSFCVEIYSGDQLQGHHGPLVYDLT